MREGGELGGHEGSWSRQRRRDVVMRIAVMYLIGVRMKTTSCGRGGKWSASVRLILNKTGVGEASC